jgi:uncharacterized membrane protein (DUF2068 family)
MHQTVGNSLQVLRHFNPPGGAQYTPQALLDTALANTIYATCASYIASLMTTLGTLAFHQDMVMNVLFMADFNLNQQYCQHLIDERCSSATASALHMTIIQIDKRAPRAEGPFQIHSVHTNRTLTLQTTPFVRERISIRNVKLFVP